ncbi:ZIP zinc transporter-domain-containing protein [Coniochaeta sp. 2T2.1]|nr:ZIP zinc transporter-domain-containing protein [Coniochaeta sp. 2T2.1]
MNGFGGRHAGNVSRRSDPPAGWLAWIASVVVVATLISLLQGSARWSPLLSVMDRRSPPSFGAVAESPAGRPRIRRQDATRSCAAGGVGRAEYDLPLHVGALFIILGASSLACGFPMLAARFPVLRIPETFFFGVRHFGTGVLLATAFVHLLPTAFISLGNPCLSSFWVSDYPAMPGAIALLGIFFVAVMEMIFSPARHFSPSTSNAVVDARAGKSRAAAADSPQPVRRRTGTLCGGGHADITRSITRPSAPVAVSGGTELERIIPVTGEPSDREAAVAGHVLTPEQQHKKDILQCMMLEVGILFHSVFIGMALSVSIGGNFVVLLIAIAFHQTFEGLALGSRIANISWPEKSWQPWLMVLAYGCTTPVGQAIGLAMHSVYNPDSEFGLILVGTMNAVSSGLLVFAALIELLAEDFLSDHSWLIMRGRKRVFACLLVFLGAALMSLVGAWA